MDGYMASLDTQHFEFHAFGATEAEARKALGAGFRKHLRDCDIPAKEVSSRWAEFEDSVNVLRFEAGRAYRDGREID